MNCARMYLYIRVERAQFVWLCHASQASSLQAAYKINTFHGVHNIDRFIVLHFTDTAHRHPHYLLRIMSTVHHNRVLHCVPSLCRLRSQAPCALMHTQNELQVSIHNTNVHQAGAGYLNKNRAQLASRCAPPLTRRHRARVSFRRRCCPLEIARSCAFCLFNFILFSKIILLLEASVAIALAFLYFQFFFFFICLLYKRVK